MMNEIEFNRVVGEIRFTWAHGDFVGAAARIEAVINELTPEMRAHCLLLKGQMMDDQGSASDARRDWLTAIPYSRAGSFGRYCLEYEVGSSYEKSALRLEAIGFYRSAIQTCADGDEFSCNKALSAFLTLNHGQIPSEDEMLVAAAVEKSWRVLELEGHPDLSDLSKAVAALADGFSDKVRRAKEGL